jgi:F-type H+-transporting ATPase subunit gamma
MLSNKLQRFCQGGMTQARFLQQQNAAAMLMPISQRNFGANEKVLSLRIKAVGNIGKITKAMKMVAAAKMRGDLVRLDNGAQFGFNGIDLMFKSDTYMQRRAPDVPADPRELLVPITSDRGLCGAINSGIFRHIRTYIKGKSDRTKLRLFPLG